MKCKLVASELLCAALLLGCSSPPKLTLPSGDWVEVSQPSAPPRISTYEAAPPAVNTQSGPAASVPFPYAAVPIGPAKPAAPPLSRPVSAVVPPPQPLAGAPAATTPIAGSPAVGAAKPAPTALVAAPVIQPKTPATPAVAPTKTFPSTPAAPVATVVAPAPKTLKPVPVPKPIWEARVGDSLRKVIEGWSQKAHYQVDWQVEDLDYSIDAPLRFQGTYEEAVASIFQLYEKADRSFDVDGRRSQGRLIVSEDRDKTKRAPK
ncbi:TcpQ domain-containing protein [Pseudomonas chlororaphis]|uniref:TcpQ domain-containing protein n=1 Tax=Pseudomonas chlororaphis TaxID=587753 RepID=UPI002D796DE3|nr:TcpQ domain-containing protein [Pseudomonas chlororaphis]